jgi:hypothetical protein
MNAIRRAAHCYGFVLDQPHDRAYVLSVLVLAGARKSRRPAKTASST